MKNIERVAILGGQRIPFARRFTAYSDVSNQEMLTEALRALTTKFGLKDQRIGEVVGGAVIKGSRENLTRESVMGCGLSAYTPAYDLQEACVTSLQASIAVSNKIALGQIENGIACGADSFSDVPIEYSKGMRKILLRASIAKTFGEKVAAWSGFSPALLAPSGANGNEPRTGLSMGEHCELMVKEWKIDQAAQDELALRSHQNGSAAFDRGFYDDLVVPFHGLKRDNNLRADTTLAKLSKLKPAFDSKNGTLTAGNSTAFTDGASAALLASESWAKANGFEPLAWIIDAETAAVDYVNGGEGLLMAPAHAVSRLLERNGLSLQDFDYYEIHEAFAGQVLCTLKAWESTEYCQKRLGLAGALGSIDRKKLNINGGSVGLGHPFAATGTRILAGAAKQLAIHRKETGNKGRTLVTACAAGGTGAALILEG